MPRQHGQSLAEYVLFVGVVLLALSVMQVYIKRSLQGQFKAVADYSSSIMRYQSSKVITKATKQDQYEPYYVVTGRAIGEHAESTEQMNLTGTVDRTKISQLTTESVNSQTVTRGSSALGLDSNW